MSRSTFACGNLFLTEHAEVVKAHMIESSYLVRLSDRWVCYMTGQDGKPDDGLYSFELYRMAREVPVLIFDHEVESGWGYCILADGRVDSDMYINYADYFALSPYDLSPKQVAGMLRRSLFGSGNDRPAPPSMDELGRTFERVRIDAFRLFGADADAIDELRDIFTIRSLFDNKTRYRLVERFEDALSFRMDFVSYTKVKEYGEQAFDIIAKR